LDKIISNLGIAKFAFFLILVGWPLEVIAHQPRIVESEKVVVTNPEISKAYYGRLSGQPHSYIINSSSAIELYVNILVPFVEGTGKNIIVKISKNDQYLAKLNPGAEDWRKFFEPFGQSTYWQGPEFKIRAEAGKYKILVKSRENNIRYVLAIGEIEAFDGIESLKAILLIPDLKRSFFEESPSSFILSPLGWGYILFLQFLTLLIAWIISRVLKMFGIKIQKEYSKKTAKKIIVGNVIFWVALLFWAVKTTWHPIIVVMSGLALFYALNIWRNLMVSKYNNV
jgi:hypothetical protein